MDAAVRGAFERVSSHEFVDRFRDRPAAGERLAAAADEWLALGSPSWASWRSTLRAVAAVPDGEGAIRRVWHDHVRVGS